MKAEELIKSQLDEMAKYKWIESEKAGYDLGDQALLDWVDKYAERYRASTYRSVKSK